MSDTQNNDEIEEQPPVNLPEGLQVQMQGFEEELSRTVGNDIAAITRELSRYLPLNNLVGFTVAWNYHETLANIDRGIDGAIPATATNDEELGEGIAMALPVVRDGMIKTHIVLGPHIVGLIASENELERDQGYKLVVHELAHAADHAAKQQALGLIYTQQPHELIPDPKELYIWELSHCIWDEYYASRVSAPFAEEEEPFEDELFSNAYITFRDRLREARRDYHWGRISLDEFLQVLAYNLRIVLLSAGYLFGLLDAKESEMAEIAPRSASLFDEPEGQMISRFHPVLLDIWERRGEWDSFDEFLALNRPAENMLNDLDCYLSTTNDNQVYIDIPARIEHVS